MYINIYTNVISCAYRILPQSSCHVCLLTPASLGYQVDGKVGCWVPFGATLCVGVYTI